MPALQRGTSAVRWVAGCMTGTSLDGLDAALVVIHGHGLAMRAEFHRALSRPLGALGPRLRALAEQEPLAAGEIASLARDFAMLHLDAVRELMVTVHTPSPALPARGDPDASGPRAGGVRGGALTRERLQLLRDGPALDLVCVHGQTVFHAPPLSWQLFNPGPLAWGLGVPVVYDLRAADLACGGQGAPITPLADFIFFRHRSEARAVVNLGGFCNITFVPASGAGAKHLRERPCSPSPLEGEGRDESRRSRDESGMSPDASGSPGALSRAALSLKGRGYRHATAGVHGGDVCACNQVLDAVSREVLGVPYDEDGRRAAAGRVLREPFAKLLSLLTRQARSQRSLGTGDELRGWLAAWRGRGAPEDLARCACAAVAEAIARYVRTGRSAGTPPARAIVAGGGARNATLLAELRARAGIPVDESDAHGIPAAYREAAAFAVLGALCQDRVPITLPQVTGVPRRTCSAGFQPARAPVSGCWALP